MIGQTIGTYKINEFIGEGGMGSVYRATDTSLQREVAIKMLHVHLHQKPDLLNRFRNEALLSAKINHPNVATLYQFINDSDRGYLVMEYIDGQNLENLLKKHQSFALETSIQMLIQLAEGLRHAHHKGIIHRDIKPGNLMLNKEGYVKLMDFGIARIENSERLTRVNHVIGTTAYLAPELLQGNSPSIGSDLYAVGVLGYELYYGSTPFAGSTDSSLIHQIVHNNPTFTTKSGTHVEKKYIKILKQLLHRNPAKRIQSTTELIAKLEELGNYTKIEIQNPRNVGNTKNPTRTFSTILHEVRNIMPNMHAWLPKFRTIEGRILALSLIVAVVFVLFGLSRPTIDQQQPSDPELTTYLSNQPDKTDLDLQSEGPNYINANPVEELPISQPEEQEDQRDESTANEDETQDAKATTVDSSNIRIADVKTDQNENQDTSSRQDNESQDEPNIQKEKSNDPIDDTNQEDMNESGHETPIMDDPEYPKTDESEEINELPNDHADEVVKARTFQLPRHQLTVVFPESISSETHHKNQVIYMTNQNPILHNGEEIIMAGARVKARIKEARAHSEYPKAHLSIQFESVEAIDGTWIPVKYPEYSMRSDEPITFSNGTTIRKIIIKPQIITISLPTK